MMDPLGLSLENFDAVGKWRTLGESSAPIDASGRLPDGTTFEGPAGLREALLRSDRFVATLTEKMLTYALGPRARVLRRAGRARDRARGGAERLSLLVADRGRRAERAVPDAARRRWRGAGGPQRQDRGEQEETPMFITKTALPRRTFLRGLGAALALPLLDAMVPALSALAQTPAQPAPPARVRLHAERRRAELHGHQLLDAGRRGRDLRAVADPDAARAVPRSAGRRQRPGAAPGRRARRRRQRRSHARHQLVADRRAPQAHRRRRRAQRHLGRSDRGGGARQGHGAAVARARASTSTSWPASARTATAART